MSEIWAQFNMEGFEMGKEPKFCHKCGEKVLITTKIGEFDIYTGDEVLTSKTFKCPHYNRLFGSRHFLLTMQFDIDDSNVVNKRPI